MNGKTYFYIAIAALVLSAVALGLAFSPLGVYSLIASVIFEITALSLLATQKKKYYFKGVLYLTVIAYSLMALSAALFIGGMIYNSIQV